MSMSAPPVGQEPKRQRGHLRVAAIMKAGAELFAEKGYDGTTMTEIASRSGTAIASLYRFFPTKESLAEALLRQYAKHALDGLAEIAARANAMTPESLADAFIEYSLALQSERSFAIDLADVGSASGERRQQFRKAMLKSIAGILVATIPSIPLAKARLMAGTLMTVFKGLSAIPDEKPAIRRALTSEAKAMVALYLGAAANAAA
ncbi:helix-turn-helix domain-containing protein [Hyphomicrobium sp.]|uniref:TetR/AcrR family transcriptional regulator n=1 Tax=Hyphomicrobium sp. TaxID=82 RepID=UPI002D78F4B5|nr:helix-turn-helix domain-containing protein [Hyphomicrobium sp.]HET6389359.1 helix-turn-helix domain-containing protein [Hyphomicrobium sp.]